MTLVKERPMTEAVPFKSEQPKPKNAGTVGWLKESIHKSRNGLFSEIKTITPGLAEVILSNNEHNRYLSDVTITNYASDMLAGRWHMNGQGIVIAKTGELNDGQHRLKAIIHANIPVEMLVTFGAERESRTTLDQGKKRTVGDYLGMDGYVNSKIIAALVRKIISFENANRAAVGTMWNITPSQMLERVEADRQILETSARWAALHAKKMRSICNVSVLAFVHNILMTQHTNDAIDFLNQFVTGENLQRGDGAFMARERLLSLSTNSNSRGRTKTDAVSIEIIFRAWNAYRERRPISIIPITGRLPVLV